MSELFDDASVKGRGDRADSQVVECDWKSREFVKPRAVVATKLVRYALRGESTRETPRPASCL